MILEDVKIEQLAQDGMIKPFSPSLIRIINYSDSSGKAISYGLGSYGYDLRLSPNDFRVFRHIPGTIVDPKNFNPDNLESSVINLSDRGDYFILPAHSYGLGVAVERLNLPPNITAFAIGKSTYARCGIVTATTPVEAGWEGFLTIELANTSNTDCKVYANEGIVQLIFLEGKPCRSPYGNRKYQNQKQEVTLAK